MHWPGVKPAISRSQVQHPPPSNQVASVCSLPSKMPCPVNVDPTILQLLSCTSVWNVTVIKRGGLIFCLCPIYWVLPSKPQANIKIIKSELIVTDLWSLSCFGGRLGRHLEKNTYTFLEVLTLDPTRISWETFCSNLLGVDGLFSIYWVLTRLTTNT